MRVAVVGMGQGGMVAGIKLAERGHDVTIFERNEKGQVGYDWYDDITASVFTEAGLPRLPRYAYENKGVWRFISPDEKNSLKLVPSKPFCEISVHRRALAEYFGNLAEEAGCNILYGAPVESLIIEEERVVGVRFCGNEEKFDLVIDASGQNSPFRKQIPARFGISGDCEKEGVMKGYRAFFNARENVEKPVPECNLIVKHLGGKGISWCNALNDGIVDVLIGRIGELSDEEIRLALEDLRKNFAILPSEEPIKEYKVDIGVRCPIAAFVADGYALIGDSAFMSMPLMGNGIESAIKAGKIFADTVIDNGIFDFTAKNMWQYQRKFFKEIGKDFVFVDMWKRFALGLDEKLVNKVFACGVIKDEDTALIALDGITPKPTVGRVIKMCVGIIVKNPKLVFKALAFLPKAIRAMRVAGRIPHKYGKKSEKWRIKYEETIKKTDKATAK